MRNKIVSMLLTTVLCVGALSICIPPSVASNATSITNFTDVSKNDYYYDAVNWAVKQGITTGTSATTFSPNDTCTRAQVITFMWRMAGGLLLERDGRFLDVTKNDYYYYPANWSHLYGIMREDTTMFYPNKSCTRGDFVLYMWHAAEHGIDDVDASPKFLDVTKSNDKELWMATWWAYERGITQGTTDTTFSPDNVCTRAEVVTFLYRYNLSALDMKARSAGVTYSVAHCVPNFTYVTGVALSATSESLILPATKYNSYIYYYKQDNMGSTAISKYRKCLSDDYGFDYLYEYEFVYGTGHVYHRTVDGRDFYVTLFPAPQNLFGVEISNEKLY